MNGNASDRFLPGLSAMKPADHINQMALFRQRLRLTPNAHLCEGVIILDDHAVPEALLVSGITHSFDSSLERNWELVSVALFNRRVYRRADRPASESGLEGEA